MRQFKALSLGRHWAGPWITPGVIEYLAVVACIRNCKHRHSKISVISFFCFCFASHFIADTSFLAQLWLLINRIGGHCNVFIL